MAINVSAKKRGWGYDYSDSTLNAYVDGVEAFSLTSSGGPAYTMSATYTSASLFGIRVQNVFTLTTTGNHKAIIGETTYTPATSGYGSPIGVAAKVSLAGNFTGGTGYMWGVQAQLDLGTSRTINNAGSIFAGVRGVITGTTPTFTDADEICCFYGDNLCQTSMAGMSTGNSSILRGHVVDPGGMDNFLHLWASNHVTNFMNFEACGGMVDTTTVSAETSSGRIKILIDSSTFYLYYWN